MNDPLDATQAARLTAPVASAIATLALRGPQAIPIVERHLRTISGKLLHLAIDQPRFALWHSAELNLPPEHVVVVRLAEQYIEIHCHGGLAVSNMIFDDIQRSGGEFQVAEVILGRQSDEDIYQVAARQALAKAPTLKVAAILMDQWQGALSASMREMASYAAVGNRLAAEELRQLLLARSQFGLRLIDPWRLTLAGPPNVGKSSLTNALYGSRRVLVHDQPGTTRDAVETTIVIDSWPIKLIDTAGVRESVESIEQLGIEATQRRWRSSDLGLLVLDAATGWTTTHDQLVADRHGPIIVVLNKIDQCQGASAIAMLEQLEERVRQRVSAQQLIATAPTSAVTSEGVQPLLQAIGSFLNAQAPPAGAAVPFLPEHREALIHFRESLD